MFGRFGWAEILVIVVLVLILFGHNKIPGMMKNLADGINVFKKELKNTKAKKTDAGKILNKKENGDVKKVGTVKGKRAPIKKMPAKKANKTVKNKNAD